MDVIVPRCGALDVHKDTVMAAVRTPGRGRARRQVVREFRTFTGDLRTSESSSSSDGPALLGGFRVPRHRVG